MYRDGPILAVSYPNQYLYQDVGCAVKEVHYMAALMMLLVVLYLGSMIMLYNKDDSEHPFYIVYILGAGLGGTLLSPNVPRWLILIVSIVIVIGILKLRYLMVLIFIPQGLIIFSLGCLCLRDVRSHGHDIATAIISLFASNGNDFGIKVPKLDCLDHYWSNSSDYHLLSIWR